MGIEVSATPPFLRKNTNELLSSLSPRLREKLETIRGHQTVSFSGNAHRFWIQTGKLTVAGSQGSDRIISRYG
jgi:predicted transcriptional regulator